MPHALCPLPSALSFSFELSAIAFERFALSALSTMALTIWPLLSAACALPYAPNAVMQQRYTLISW